jgi:hypothetical protein
MSARSFRSVFMVASCAGAALGCYLVSLRVASERAALESVETEIVLAQRDIRLLQTEIGTRGRLAQLERWNVRVLALSAPSADQFLEGGFALAKMVSPRDKVDLDAPMVLAAAPADGPKPQIQGAPQPDDDAAEGVSAKQMLHVASLKRETRPIAENSAKAKQASKPAPEKSAAPTKATTVAKARPTPSERKTATVDRRAAAVDPLAPIATPVSKPKKVASPATPGSVKENGSKQ